MTVTTGNFPKDLNPGGKKKDKRMDVPDTPPDRWNGPEKPDIDWMSRKQKGGGGK